MFDFIINVEWMDDDVFVNVVGMVMVYWLGVFVIGMYVVVVYLLIMIMFEVMVLFDIEECVV